MKSSWLKWRVSSLVMQSFCVPTSKVIGEHRLPGAELLPKALNASLTAYALFGTNGTWIILAISGQRYRPIAYELSFPINVTLVIAPPGKRGASSEGRDRVESGTDFYNPFPVDKAIAPSNLYSRQTLRELDGFVELRLDDDPSVASYVPKLVSYFYGSESFGESTSR